MTSLDQMLVGSMVFALCILRQKLVLEPKKERNMMVSGYVHIARCLRKVGVQSLQTISACIFLVEVTKSIQFSVLPFSHLAMEILCFGVGSVFWPSAIHMFGY